MSKGSQTTTTQTGPPSYVNQAYKQLVANTQNLAQTPYTPFGGEGVAPVNPQQYQGIGNINQYAFEAQPYYGLAGGLMAGAASPLDASQIMNYYNPYQQQVIGTTEQQFNLMNQMALNNIQGSAAAQGALGGDAPGVAKAAYYQGVLPGQEQTIAGLESQGYNQALATAAGQYQQNPEAVAYGLGNLGAGAQAAALQGAGAQISGGTLEQNTQQALDQYLYNQYLAQMGYPFALNQYAAGIIGGLGSQAGGTSTTTGPPPSMLASLLGLGVAGAGAYGAYQGAQPKTTAERGGRVKGYQTGGSPILPYAGAPSYIPSGNILAHGNTLPKPPGTQTQSGGASDIFGNATQLAGLGKMGQGIGSGLAGLGGGSAAVTPEAWGAAGLDLGTIGPGVAAADVGAGAAADAGAAGAADLLPLLLLAQGGGRINYPGGLALPDKGRIQLPMRAGMGMPSFVHRQGYQEGGTPSFGDELLALNMDRDAYATPVQTTRIPSSEVSSDVIPGETSLPLAEASSPGGDVGNFPAAPVGASSAGLAYAPEQAPPGGGVYAPSGGVGAGYPALPPRLPPSARPQTVPGQGGPGFLGMSPEFWSSVMTAGLGMMASAQPGVPAGVAIGRGALEGVGAYGSMKKGEADIEMQARKLDQAAQAEQDRIAHETQALQQQAQLHREMTPYQKFETSQPRPIGSRIDQYGNRIPIYGTQDKNGNWVEVPISPTGTGLPSLPPVPTVPPALGAPTSQQPSGVQVASSDDTPEAQAEAAELLKASGLRTAEVLKPSEDVNKDVFTNPLAGKQLNEHALDDLSAGQRNVVKWMVQGKIPVPSSFALAKPFWQQMLEHAANYDPDGFDAARWGARNAALKDMTSGMTARNVIRRMNTAANHLDQLDQDQQKLDNWASGAFGPFTGMANKARIQYLAGVQDPRVRNVNVDADAVSRELETAFKGNNPTETGLKEWRANMAPGMAKDESRSANNRIVNLVKGQLDSVSDQWQRAFGTRADPTMFLSPKAKAIYERIGGDLNTPTPSGKIDAQTRFGQLVGEGKTKEQAYAQMHQEGY